MGLRLFHNLRKSFTFSTRRMETLATKEFQGYEALDCTDCTIQIRTRHIDEGLEHRRTRSEFVLSDNETGGWLLVFLPRYLPNLTIPSIERPSADLEPAGVFSLGLRA